MKHTVRSFSIGLFTAGVITLIGYYFFGSESAQTKELTVEEMAPLAEEEGYRIIAEEEYISLSVNNDSSPVADEEEEEEGNEENTEDQDESEEDVDEEEENGDDEASNEEENEEEEEEITTYTLNIEPGMTTSEFSSLLEENNIVEDASEFNQYIEDEDYSLRVQIGEFELTSDMSMYDVAEEITR